MSDYDQQADRDRVAGRSREEQAQNGQDQRQRDNRSQDQQQERKPAQPRPARAERLQQQAAQKLNQVSDKRKRDAKRVLGQDTQKRVKALRDERIDLRHREEQKVRKDREQELWGPNHNNPQDTSWG